MPITPGRQWLTVGNHGDVFSKIFFSLPKTLFATIAIQLTVLTIT